MHNICVLLQLFALVVHAVFNKLRGVCTVLKIYKVIQPYLKPCLAREYFKSGDPNLHGKEKSGWAYENYRASLVGSVGHSKSEYTSNVND